MQWKISQKPGHKQKESIFQNFLRQLILWKFHFSIWNKNADGSESQMKEFTSLLGSQKKKLLNRLCSKLSEVIYPDTCETVKQIWTDFEGLYNQISDFNLSKTAPNVIFVQAKAWVELFCSLKRMRPEYTRPRVTPYIHTLVPYIHTPLLC